MPDFVQMEPREESHWIGRSGALISQESWSQDIGRWRAALHFDFAMAQMVGPRMASIVAAAHDVVVLYLPHSEISVVTVDGLCVKRICA